MIGLLSFIVWLHHFFTMGSGANVNAFFGITTMVIAVPTGVKVFNWLFTMYRGNIAFKTPMLWIMAFFTTFAIGGMTGVMMAIITPVIPPIAKVVKNAIIQSIGVLKAILPRYMVNNQLNTFTPVGTAITIVVIPKNAFTLAPDPMVKK